MAKRFQFIISVSTVLGLMFLFMACGGGGGSDSVTYNGSNDPAVADSTTAATLVEYALGATEAGFPLVTPFVTPPPGMVFTTLSAQPLAPGATTTVTIPVPPQAVYGGSAYDGTYGTGTADLNGSLTLYLSAESALANTWSVISGELNGSIVFDNFRTEEGPGISGTVTVPSSTFYFSGEALFEMSTMSIPSDPGFPVWQELEMTFTNIAVSEDQDSWSLGEGDWYLQKAGDSVTLDIYSVTVEYDGSTYKLEDTELNVQAGMVPAALGAAQPLIVVPDTINFQFSGITTSNGTFYHPDLGVTYFSGDLTESDPPGDLTSGTLSFYDGADEANLLFNVYFGYDETYNEGQGATFYNLYMNTEEYFEKGYFIDGSFIMDANAPTLIL